MFKAPTTPFRGMTPVAEQFLKWWPVLLFLMNALIVWIGWSMTQAMKGFATKDSVTDAKNEIETEQRAAEARSVQLIHGIDKRVGALEERTKHMPSHDDLRRLHQRLDEINAGVNKLAGEVHGISRSVGLINQHLLDGRRSE